MNNYTAFDHCRQFTHERAKRCYGGVSILVKNDLFESYRIEIVGKGIDGVLAILLSSKNFETRILIIATYLPPENSPWGRDATLFFEYVLSLIFDYNDCDLSIIGGDFNARVGKLHDYIDFVDEKVERTSIDSTVNSHGKEFIQFLIESGYNMINGRITPQFDNFTSISIKGRSVVDYFIVPIDCLQLCEYFKVHPIKHVLSSISCQSEKHSDHSVIELKIRVIQKINIGANVTDSNVITKNSDIIPINVSNDFPLFYRRYKLEKVLLKVPTQGHIDSMNMLLYNYEHCNIDTCMSIDEFYDKFISIYHIFLSDCIKCNDVRYVKHKRHSPKPFWNDELDKLWKTAEITQSQYLMSLNSQNRANLRINFITAQQKYDTRFRYYKRKFEINKQTNIEHFKIKNPREFWNAIKSIGPQRRVVQSIPWKAIDSNGDITTNKVNVLDIWRANYKCLFTIDYNQCTDFDLFISHEINCFVNNNNNIHVYDNDNILMNGPILPQEIRRAINTAKLNKSVGIDGIPNEAIKNKFSIIYLEKLFNHVFIHEKFPNSWRTSIVKPIPKKSTIDSHDPLQYRGISLLCIMYKLYAYILNDRLVFHMEHDDRYIDEQNGFRRLRSCEEHIFVLTSIIKNRKYKKMSTFVAYLDAEKAFDKVNRNYLLYKLIKHDVTGKLFKAIELIYQSSHCSIAINDCFTDCFSTNAGVRQGDPLSSTLFNIFMNDFVQFINDENTSGVEIENKQISCLLFADDIVIFSENEQNLQYMLQRAEEWGKLWGIKFNVRKSHIIHHRPKSVDRSKHKFIFGQSQLECIDKCMYLGVVMDEYAEFVACTDTLASSGTRALGAIINKLKHNSLGYKTYTKLFETGVLPILSWGAPIWGIKKFPKIQTVQNKAMRAFLSVNTFTSNVCVSGDMGWLDCLLHRKLLMLKFWNRIIKINNNRIVKAVFLFDFGMCKRNWCSDIKSIATEIGQIQRFQTKLSFDIQDAKHKLMELNIIEWKISVNKNAKTGLYRQIKTEYSVEYYVNRIYNRRNRSLLARLRAGCLDLEIERGRWRGISKESRICKLCFDGIEDEIHFLFICTKLEFVRVSFHNLLNDLNTKYNNNVDKFNMIFCPEYLIPCSKYVRMLYDNRKTLLYSVK